MMQLNLVDLSGLGDGLCRAWLDAVLPDVTDWQTCAAPEALPPEGRALLIYAAPDRQIAAALRAGVPIEQATADWQSQAQAILAQWRRGRRRLFLIDADAFAAAPEALAERLAQWLDCAAGPVPAPDPALEPALPEDIHGLLAAQAALALPELRQLADELEAGGVSPRRAGTGSLAQLAAVSAAWQDRDARADDDQANAAQDQALQQAQSLFDEEIELLQLQLRTAQQALEREYRDRLAERQTAADEIRALRAELEQAHLHLSTVRAEQARQVAALLDGHRDLMVARGALQAELNHSRHEIDALFASTSWRVTAPLRRARRVVAKPA
ncbi:OmpH family outer membrane protein [Sedimentitalea sp. HM32M-2]|uniref:OmpH family outer membrane protein n=1 Tax=Sedimentitalea sp. HM32M-2 TaxID=3351566 RepID=UPI00362B92DE